MLIILGPNFEYLQNGTYVSTARRVTQIFIAYAVVYRSAMIAYKVEFIVLGIRQKGLCIWCLNQTILTEENADSNPHEVSAWIYPTSFSMTILLLSSIISHFLKKKLSAVYIFLLVISPYNMFFLFKAEYQSSLKLIET
jgi:hypothetical protein